VKVLSRLKKATRLALAIGASEFSPWQTFLFSQITQKIIAHEQKMAVESE
jgi:hypothetical protein